MMVSLPFKESLIMNTKVHPPHQPHECISVVERLHEQITKSRPYDTSIQAFLSDILNFHCKVLFQGVETRYPISGVGIFNSHCRSLRFNFKFKSCCLSFRRMVYSKTDRCRRCRRMSLSRLDEIDDLDVQVTSNAYSNNSKTFQNILIFSTPFILEWMRQYCFQHDPSSQM